MAKRHRDDEEEFAPGKRRRQRDEMTELIDDVFRGKVGRDALRGNKEKWHVVTKAATRMWLDLMKRNLQSVFQENRAAVLDDIPTRLEALITDDMDEALALCEQEDRSLHDLAQLIYRCGTLIMKFLLELAVSTLAGVMALSEWMTHFIPPLAELLPAGATEKVVSHIATEEPYHGGRSPPLYLAQFPRPHLQHPELPIIAAVRRTSRPSPQWSHAMKEMIADPLFRAHTANRDLPFRYDHGAPLKVDAAPWPSRFLVAGMRPVPRATQLRRTAAWEAMPPVVAEIVAALRLKGVSVVKWTPGDDEDERVLYASAIVTDVAPGFTVCTENYREHLLAIDPAQVLLWVARSGIEPVVDVAREDDVPDPESGRRIADPFDIALAWLAQPLSRETRGYLLQELQAQTLGGGGGGGGGVELQIPRDAATRYSEVHWINEGYPFLALLCYVLRERNRQPLAAMHARKAMLRMLLNHWDILKVFGAPEEEAALAFENWHFFKCSVCSRPAPTLFDLARRAAICAPCARV